MHLVIIIIHLVIDIMHLVIVIMHLVIGIIILGPIKLVRIKETRLGH